MKRGHELQVFCCSESFFGHKNADFRVCSLIQSFCSDSTHKISKWIFHNAGTWQHVFLHSLFKSIPKLWHFNKFTFTLTVRYSLLALWALGVHFAHSLLNHFETFFSRFFFFDFFFSIQIWFSIKLNCPHTLSACPRTMGKNSNSLLWMLCRRSSIPYCLDVNGKIFFFFFLENYQTHIFFRFFFAYFCFLLFSFFAVRPIAGRSGWVRAK